MIKKIIFKLLRPFTKQLMLFSVKWIKANMHKKYSEKFFMDEGMLPVLDHYYQPMINPQKHLTKSLREDRDIVGINYNVKEQLEILANFNFNNELLEFPIEKKNENEFYYNNGAYESGDAEYLYNVVRYFKPNRIIEIGSGNSTLMVKNAITKNKIENSSYTCNHICIEPYEMPWLKEVGVELIREKVECIEKSFFQKLSKNDILFIDSSHIIRPQGDVLFEYLELIPSLNSGVLVHIHDIFTPKDYLDEWVLKEHRLWNEQYLLEAFLTFNSEYRIMGALNYLSHNFTEEFSVKSPIYAKQHGREPGAFWMIKK